MWGRRLIITEMKTALLSFAVDKNSATFIADCLEFLRLFSFAAFKRSLPWVAL